ncbi:hypothetical protein [Rubripirellula reticaptiva]|uniref:YHS domain protein n=1 Tax=Rubripirellula reticaptiva TaxID=2528013 RepID=A0A5C6EHS5_9BACT|nr:hypothetical protein [Rubripirellula reticaptiva]TWU46769.1 hypothetical protein Poly59_57420 [Rubripirellula reticaptiva]
MRYFISSTAGLLLVFATVAGCNKSADTATTSPTPEAVEATAVNFANAKCPIMGGKPSAELTTEYDGKTIGFCCDGCPEKWAALTDEDKAEKFAKVNAHAAHDHAAGESAAGDHDHSDHSDE